MILYQYAAASPRLLHLITPADALLFRQDGVYQLLSEQQWPTSQLYVLQQDLTDRQLPCPPSVQQLSDAQWIELTLKAQQVVLC